MNSPRQIPRWVYAALIGVLACVSPAPENAPGPVPQPPDAADPPSRVGRLDVVEGVVSFRPAQGDTWALAVMNHPVTTGDRLWVDSVGHAEVEVGQDAFRLTRETEVDVERLDDNALQLRLPQGSTIVQVKAVGVGQDYEIDAPNAAISLTQAGEYRVDVSVDGATTTVTVRDSGEAEVTATGSTFTVRTNQSATVQGDSAPTYNIGAVAPPDDFDQWSTARDQREDEATASSRYVSPEMGGVADLAQGQWDQDADYGPVWYPPVAVDWVPYRFGHWVWIDPWGWTWVEDEPWGWAPFHYGRWAYFGARWGWCPGPALYTPVYAPALIAFVGGPGWGVSFGLVGGGVGWFPLGPREPFIPWYHGGIAYRERVNVVSVTHINVSNVSNISYRYRSQPGAVTAVQRTTFADGAPVGRAAVRLPADAASSARVVDNPGVVPTEHSVLPSAVNGGRPAPTVPPARLASRPVVANHPPPPAPVPFSAQERAIAANGGRPLAPSQMSALRASTPGVRAAAFPVRSAVARAPNARPLTPARGGLPALRPAQGAPSVGRGRTTLENEYENERSQMETRHAQEFAQPRESSGGGQQQMFERQEQEHQELQQRYNSARTQNMEHMPAPHFSAPRGGGGRPR